MHNRLMKVMGKPTVRKAESSSGSRKPQEANADERKANEKCEQGKDGKKEGTCCLQVSLQRLSGSDLIKGIAGQAKGCTSSHSNRPAAAPRPAPFANTPTAVAPFATTNPFPRAAPAVAQPPALASSFNRGVHRKRKMKGIRHINSSLSQKFTLLLQGRCIVYMPKRNKVANQSTLKARTTHSL